MSTALTALREGGDLGEDSGLVASFRTRQATVRKPKVNGLEAEGAGG